MSSRNAPIAMDPAEFREAGHRLVDRIAQMMESMPKGKVTPNHSQDEIRALLGGARVPDSGSPPAQILDEAADLVLENSLYNGHPRFMGYITSSPAPIGVLADMLAAAVNPNVGGWVLSPVATEMELQTIAWIAELLGFPSDCGGLLVSGGNMANFVGFLAARKVKSPWNVREKGMAAKDRVPMAIFASRETHTWIQKAADLFGLGTESIFWIDVDEAQRMDVRQLRSEVMRSIEEGWRPFLVVGSAGTVSTGAVDPLPEIADIAAEFEMWFHVDGAYGALAAILPDGPPALAGIARADSVAFDPHKWLYAPLEAGCALIRNPRHLVETFGYRPSYYAIDYDRTNFYEIGPQNSRGFRALKVWLGLKQAGREGFERMVADDVALARRLFDRVSETAGLEAKTQGLSITTFRCVPEPLRGKASDPDVADYLDGLNRKVLDAVNAAGDAFLSNAVVDGRFYIRACVVNFRTTESDIDKIPDIVLQVAEKVAKADPFPALASAP